MHNNDSKCALGSRRDRHENVGRGMIGITMFECIMADPRLDGVPLPFPCGSQRPHLCRASELSFPNPKSSLISLRSSVYKIFHACEVHKDEGSSEVHAFCVDLPDTNHALISRGGELATLANQKPSKVHNLFWSF